MKIRKEEFIDIVDCAYQAGFRSAIEVLGKTKAALSPEEKKILEGIVDEKILLDKGGK
jgi:hypothetical protein